MLIPPTLPASLPIGGGHAARAVWDFNGTTMGTYWRAHVVESDFVSSGRARRIVCDALAAVVARMSPWEPHSDLGYYRSAAAGSWVPLSADTFKVLSRALEVAALTGGRYDPTIGRLTDTLGFGPTDPARAAPPGSPPALRARSATGFTRIALDPVKQAVWQPGGLQLDLCSIAKGYAVDLAIEQLAAAGMRSCFVEIGGEARGRGCKPHGQPWWCEIERPPLAGHGLPPTVAAACDLALATSGNTLRRHIVNPLPGETIEPTLETVTVLASTCMEADVMATALFLLGAEAGAKFANAHGIAALFVEHFPAQGHRERWTPRFADFLA